MEQNHFCSCINATPMMNPIRSLFSQSLIWLGIFSATVFSTKPATAEIKTAESGNVRVGKFGSIDKGR
jgi:hypothetical protein